MKAVTRNTYGGPEIIEIKKLPRPIPGADDLLVRVWATTVNRTDCAILSGTPLVQRLFTGLFKPSCPIPGTDFAGTVAAVGKEVKDFAVGDNVWGFNDNGLASQAQYLCVSNKQAVLKMPPGIDHFQAAACAEGAHYAYNFINKVKVSEGERVLIIGATGAIGSAVLQMLVAMNCEVTAVASTAKLELIKSLGAKTLIDYQKEDFVAVAEAPFALILDTVGKSSFNACKSLLTNNGVYMSSELGTRAENLYLSLITRMSKGRKVIFPFPSNIKGSMQYVQNLILAAKFKPMIDRSYPIEDIEQAYRYVLSGKKTGNVVISYE